MRCYARWRLSQGRSHLLVPFRDLGRKDFLIEGRVRLGRVLSVDLEWSIDRDETLLCEHALSDLGDAITDRDGRDLNKLITKIASISRSAEWPRCRARSGQS